ncbi:MAG: M15 family metallopeptidase [Bifidobacteriaceae bacterium]|jgi:hypothetical protein|nr:M15 family metallopeptidase [Bifidobacteriaceae bacterium]
MSRNNWPGTAIAITLCAAGIAAAAFYFGGFDGGPGDAPGPVEQSSSGSAGEPTVTESAGPQPGFADGSRPEGAPGAPEEVAEGVGQADGVLPAGATVFDSQYPGIANLDPDFLQALREAATAAKTDAVVFHVSSGWRSQSYQEQLLKDAITTYGSEAEASRWVGPPDKSAHVSGDAADLDDSEAQAWLAERGASYALCRVYQNEPWHYELRPDAKDQGCPTMYADAAHDPRLK